MRCNDGVKAWYLCCMEKKPRGALKEAAGEERCERRGGRADDGAFGCGIPGGWMGKGGRNRNASSWSVRAAFRGSDCSE